MKVSTVIFDFFIALVVCLGAARPIVCQTEKIDIIQFTSPSGWTKTPKDGLMVYSTSNKNTGGFCLLTVYPSTASAGNPNTDFAKE